MCRMRTLAERIEKQHIEAVQDCQCRFGNRAEVGEICSRAKAVRRNRRIAMKDLQGQESGSEEVELAVQAMQRDLRARGIRRFRIEDVSEHAFDDSSCGFVGIKRQFLL